MKTSLYIAGLMAFSAPLPTGGFVPPASEHMSVPQFQHARVKKPVIDKSCLMICEKWGEQTCEKWVMKCKGDAGYPKGLTLQQ